MSIGYGRGVLILTPDTGCKCDRISPIRKLSDFDSRGIGKSWVTSFESGEKRLLSYWVQDYGKERRTAWHYRAELSPHPPSVHDLATVMHIVG